jgi:hypothetical protein
VALGDLKGGLPGLPDLLGNAVVLGLESRVRAAYSWYSRE